MSATTADHAARLIERFQFKLVPLRGKVPIGEAWNTDAKFISTVAAAQIHWTRYPMHNLGVCLGPSGLCSLDADYLEGTRMVLAAEGVDIDQLIKVTPTIVGRAPRLSSWRPRVSSLDASRLSGRRKNPVRSQ